MLRIYHLCSDKIQLQNDVAHLYVKCSNIIYEFHEINTRYLIACVTDRLVNELHQVTI